MEEIKLMEVTKDTPCPHCGKLDWCYYIGNLSVCKRNFPPANGWEQTSKLDSDGSYFYAPKAEKKAIRPKAKRIWDYTTREGAKLVRVVRLDDGKGKRQVWQESWDKKTNKWKKGIEGIEREEIPIYRYQDIQEAINNGQVIFIVEGESCADSLWKLGLPATTNIRGAGKWKSSDAEDLVGAQVVICPDRDQPGIKHALEIAEYFPDAQWLIPFPDSPVWQDPPPSSGLDIADWIADFQLTAEDLIKSVKTSNYIKESSFFSYARTRGKEKEININIEQSTDVVDSPTPEPQKLFTQQAYEELFGDDRLLSLGSNLYRWTGTHYSLCSEAEEKRRIQGWLNDFAEWGRDGLKYRRANSRSVDEVWRWVVAANGVDPNRINPPGLNCKNGTLEISWYLKNGTPTAKWELTPHRPDRFYTYCSEVIYDPQADSTDCDRLLECLEPAQRQIFLRTIASALDLPSIRKYCGRMIKMLLLWGEGANGKDALREAVSCVFGVGLTAATISDFQSYDQGRKFSLAKLEGSLINWSSENTKFANLDSLQSVKQFATGDPISIERKGKDEYIVCPKAVGLFNCNEAPSLRGGMDAVSTRWSIIKFNKTFKKNADLSRGELEADPRFKYDPDFLSQSVAPALLNKLLRELETLVSNGVDYSFTNGAFQELQEESCHLWQFIREHGIEYEPAGKIYCKDIWAKLQTWYIADGTLEIDERGKHVWSELPRKNDKLITGPNQIRARFIELFPKADYQRETQGERKGQLMLIGLKMSGEAAVRQSETLKPLQDKAVRQSEADLQNLANPETLKPLQDKAVRQSEADLGGGKTLKPLQDKAVRHGEAKRGFFNHSTLCSEQQKQDQISDLVSELSELETQSPEAFEALLAATRQYVSQLPRDKKQRLKNAILPHSASPPLPVRVSASPDCLTLPHSASPPLPVRISASPDKSPPASPAANDSVQNRIRPKEIRDWKPGMKLIFANGSSGGVVSSVTGKKRVKICVKAGNKFTEFSPEDLDGMGYYVQV